MHKQELLEILDKHKKWLNNEPDGEQADLSHKDLSLISLPRHMDLRKINFKGANLRQVNFSDADLSGCIFCYADLEDASLFSADLCNSDFTYARLNGANLKCCKIQGTCFSHAFLEGTQLPNGLYQVVGIGRQHRCTTYDSVNDRVICGCWDDYNGNHLDSFRARVNIYSPNGDKPNPRSYCEYTTAITYFESLKAISEKFGEQLCKY